jgi:hypothetical protein
MSKFKFTCINGDGGEDMINTLEFDASYLPEVLQGFEQFLRGSGYHFRGELDFCSDEDCKEEPMPQDVCISEEYTYTMPMPGTIGGAELSFPNERCKVCGLTSEQLGNHTCYDLNCGLK